jgi:probable O-glycosylation ligase (exosortase A-associated)
VKQTLLMIVLTLVGTFGAFVTPFYGVAVYYLFAVLRPQYIWQWAIPGEVRWSLFVALATITAGLMNAAQDDSPRAAGAPRHRNFNGSHTLMLLFAGWVTLAYITAQSRDAAWPWMVEYWKIFLMFFVSATLIKTLQQVWILMIVLASALGYIAYEVNFMYFASGYLGIYHNGYGGLDNNGAGLMLAIAVPLCIYIYMGTRRWWRWIFASLIPVLIHAVLMTYSRGAMVSLLLASPLIFLRGRNKFQLFLAALAIALVVPSLAGNEIRARFFTLNSYEDQSSAQQRFASWDAAFQMALDYPVFGVGVRNSNLFSQRYGADMEGRTIHSQFLQILADTGFPGLLLYASLLASVVLSLRRVRRWSRHRDDEEARLAYSVACGIEGALAVFFVGSLFLSLEVFELPYVLILTGAQLSLVLETQMLTSSTPAVTPPRLSHPAPRPSTARAARA